MSTEADTFARDELFRLTGAVASLVAKVDSVDSQMTQIAEDVRQTRDEVSGIREQCRDEHAQIRQELVESREAPRDYGAAIDSLTPGRLMTLAALGAIVCLTVGGAGWVARTGQLPDDFHRFSEDPAHAEENVSPDPSQFSTLTPEEAHRLKVLATGLESFLGPDGG